MGDNIGYNLLQKLLDQNHFTFKWSQAKYFCGIHILSHKPYILSSYQGGVQPFPNESLLSCHPNSLASLFSFSCLKCGHTLEIYVH